MRLNDLKLPSEEGTIEAESSQTFQIMVNIHGLIPNLVSYSRSERKCIIYLACQFNANST